MSVKVPRLRGLKPLLVVLVLVGIGCIWLGFTIAWLVLRTTQTGGTASVNTNTGVGPSSFTPSARISDTITVDVHGDVIHPGVYSLPLEARMADAIKSAGGYAHASDAEDVNAAQHLTDGEEVAVPFALQGTITSAGSSTASAVPSSAASNAMHQIDLNSADAATLETLPGIGPSRAQAILDYRQAHGPFATVDALHHVRGFGRVTMERISPYLFVSAPTQKTHG